MGKERQLRTPGGTAGKDQGLDLVLPVKLLHSNLRRPLNPP